MSRKKIIGIIILVAVAGAAWYGYKEYTRTNKDIQYTNPDFVVSAAEIIQEYENNDPAANQKYNGKIIETTGNVKNVEQDENGYYTVVLANISGLSSVRCAMDTLHQQDAAGLRPGSSATIRGACTGFNRDEMGLGSDVILNRCVVINKK